jgi:hypothetical protein
MHTQVASKIGGPTSNFRSDPTAHSSARRNHQQQLLTVLQPIELPQGSDLFTTIAKEPT